ncbi:hypothetical protein H6P81_004157 [Aristolochia fimbriata]|uniref:Enoyl reductase (ER) domain-containing protein n=1 Tax=Aristolochia fimbriata TaxID=158543 RepID=A0AAV7FGD0_ARIFI|nr:hypothetical protein H6P81_004157 [Aristolochia fimbriata]
MEVESKFVTIKAHIVGQPSESDFEVREHLVPLSVSPGSNDVVVKNLYLSVDPYQINRVKEHSASQSAISFAFRLAPGDRIDAYGVGRVVASANPGFEKDDVVVGLLHWSEYSVVGGESMLSKVDSKEFPLSYHASVLGLSGFTAYAGFHCVCKPKKGEKVFVSAASGSVGSVFGQYAKLHGCYVVGCAGSQKKVDLLKGKLGFDDAFNYKTESSDLKSALKRYFPEGIDVYFDNVGAEMLEAAVANMNTNGRVAVCGVISEYTNAQKRAAPDFLDIIYKRITLQGFLAGDYLQQYFPEFFSVTSDLLRNGKICALEDVSPGLESVPSAFCGLFRGDNVGKKLVRVAHE